MSDLTSLEIAKQGLQALIMAHGDDDGWLRGWSQAAITDLIFEYQGPMRSNDAGWVPKAIKELKQEKRIDVTVARAGTNMYRLLVEFDDETRLRCKKYIEDRERVYARALQQEREASERREKQRLEESARRVEAQRAAAELAECDRLREEARRQAELDQLEAARYEMSGRLTEVNVAARELFQITIDEVLPVSGYPAMRAKFTLSIADVVTIRKCSFFDRGNRQSVGPPTIKLGAQWVSDVEFPPDVTSWLGRSLKYVMDGGVPPADVMRPPQDQPRQ